MHVYEYFPLRFEQSCKCYTTYMYFKPFEKVCNLVIVDTLTMRLENTIINNKSFSFFSRRIYIVRFSFQIILYAIGQLIVKVDPMYIGIFSKSFFFLYACVSRIQRIGENVHVENKIKCNKLVLTFQVFLVAIK